MPWYNGLNDDEIEAMIINGRAPGSGVEDGIVEVPSGYLERQRKKKENSAIAHQCAVILESIRAPLREVIAKGLESMASAVDGGQQQDMYAAAVLREAAKNVRNKEWEK